MVLLFCCCDFFDLDHRVSSVSMRFGMNYTPQINISHTSPPAAAQSKAMLKFKLLPFSSGHSLLPPPPNGPNILIIHGKRDAVTPWICAEELMREIPHARIVGEGEIDHLEFGHTWHEYFDPERWVRILERFIGEEKVTARL
jgi:hypothetical protein